eukprot:scaffold59709_cov69-Phaeocystis_antarctica.AAC.3
MGCAQFCMFFPMIKSKSKLRTLDETWKRTMGTINWPAPALQEVAPFAVRLDEPAIALARLEERVAYSTAAAPSEAPLRIVCRTSGRPRPEVKPKGRHRPKADKRNNHDMPRALSVNLTGGV